MTLGAFRSLWSEQDSDVPFLYQIQLYYHNSIKWWIKYVRHYLLKFFFYLFLLLFLFNLSRCCKLSHPIFYCNCCLFMQLVLFFLNDKNNNFLYFRKFTANTYAAYLQPLHLICFLTDTPPNSESLGLKKNSHSKSFRLIITSLWWHSCAINS